MKINTPKVQKKVAKKAAKKDLEKTLTERFLEVITQLGHDAGRVGDDITKAGKTIAKKLAKKVAHVQEAVGLKDSPESKWDKKVDSVKAQKGAKVDKVSKNDKAGNKETVAIKVPKLQPAKTKVAKAKPEVAKPKPVAQSVKVTPITSEAHAAQALSKTTAAKPLATANSTDANKTAVAKASTPVKKRASRAKSNAAAFPVDPEMPETEKPV